MDFDVFISHSSKDAIIANAACAALEGAKIRCWIAPRDITPGTPWASAIVQAIDQCRVMVLIFSSNANSSKQIYREIDRAFSRGVPVVPLRIETAALNDNLAYFLNSVHWLDALTPPLEEHLRQLVMTVSSLVPARQPEAPVPEPLFLPGETADTEAKRRADQEQAYAAATWADSVTGLSEFLAAFPDSHLANEAKNLRAALAERDQAFDEAMDSSEVSVLGRFIERYPAGKPAMEVRRKLYQLRPPAARWASRRAILIGAGTLGTVGVGVAIASGAVKWAWTRSGDQSVRTFRGHNASINSVALAPDGRTALSAGWDGTLKLWDLQSGSELRTLTGHSKEVSTVSISPDGLTALSGSRDATIRLWELSTGRQIRAFAAGGDVSHVVIASDGRIAVSIGARDGSSLVSSAGDPTLMIWDVSSGRRIRAFDTADAIGCIALSADGATVLSGGAKGPMLWDLSKQRLIRTFASKPEAPESRQVAIAPDGRTALSADWKTLMLWDFPSGNLKQTFQVETEFINCIAFLPGGQTALLGSDDWTLRLWDTKNGREIRTFMGHTGGVTSVAVARDGRTAVSGSYDSTVKLWALA